MKQTSEEPLRRFQITAGILIAILVIIIGIMTVNSFNKDTENERLSKELEETLQLSQEIQMEYDSAIVQMDAIAGENEELKLLISENKAQLGAQKARIESLLQSSRDLTEARRQLREMVAQRERYLTELKELQEENEQLSLENENLTQEKKELRSSLQESRSRNQELTTAQEALNSEKQRLLNEKEKLANKVNRASVVETTAIRATGQMDKGEGKWKDSDRAQKIDRLLVCFDLEANMITEEKKETFYLRLLNPLGETLAIENMGSGVMEKSDTNQKIRYTTSREVQYDRKEAEVCLPWSMGTSFQPGIYTIEVYNKGYLAGTTTYQLK